MASYGKYLFLYGGINFAEEATYNDLYILNTGEISINTCMFPLCRKYPNISNEVTD